MKFTLKHEHYCIIDNFLSLEEFNLLYTFMQEEDYGVINRNSWNKIFRLTDGNPLAGTTVYSSSVQNQSKLANFPSGKAIDILINKILAREKEFNPWVGRKEEDWDYFFLRPYLYHAGTSLSWHDDGHHTSGAFIFYCNPIWNVQWGGELLIAPDAYLTPAASLKPKYNQKCMTAVGPHLNNFIQNESLLKDGHGVYAFPKPNRLILLKKGVPHAIKKVEAAAGDNARISLSGLFTKKV